MRKIYKYNFDIIQNVTINHPKGGLMTHIGIDASNGRPAIWIAFDEENEHDLVSLPLTIVGTGTPVSKDLEFLATIQDGIFVWHIFTND